MDKESKKSSSDYKKYPSRNVYTDASGEPTAKEYETPEGSYIREEISERHKEHR